MDDRPLMRTRAVAAVLVLVAAASCVQRGSNQFQARGERAAANHGDRPLGDTKPDEMLPLQVTLNPADPARLDAFLAALNDPRSPQYHHFLDAAAFGAEFGTADADLARVETWLRGAGVSVVQRYPQKTALAVEGRAVDVERLLRLRMRDFLDPRHHRRYHVPVGTPVIPDDLAHIVAGVVGLDTSQIEVSAQVKGRKGLTPQDLAKAYEIGPLHDRGLHGEGQTVAIISYDSILDSDVAEWDRRVGASGPPVEHIRLRGGTEPGDGAIEVALDVDVVRAVAPQAKILNFEAPNTGKVSDAEMMNAIVADGRADIATSSWGICDDPTGTRAQLAKRAAATGALQAAFARGMTIFNASGDAGAFDCQQRNRADLRPLPDFWSDSPYAVSVGGTYLTRSTDGSYVEEAGWEDPMERDGGGGGLNPIDDRPSWQRGPGVDNRDSNGKRQVPDVAADADSTSGYAVVYTDPEEQNGRPTQDVVGGTSGASPFWAGITVLTRQLAQQQRVGPLGPLNPILYELAATHPPNAIFHDIVKGGNLLQEATPGWDYSTGLGTPIVAPLAQAIVDYVKAHQRG
jgi:subtilase family serine protease